jgi:hypothetical protein
MGLGWDSVLKLAAWIVLIAIVLQVVFYFVFQNIGYDTYWLSINLIAFILLLIVFIIAWRIITKKLPMNP